MAKVKISISLDDKVYEFIQKLSEEESRSVSQQINKVFLDLMKKEGEK
jgi:hypothetical protein